MIEIKDVLFGLHQYAALISHELKLTQPIAGMTFEQHMEELGKHISAMADKIKALESTARQRTSKGNP